MNELDRLKSKIRQCDATILEALLERNKGIEEITLYKKEHGLPFFQREQEMGIQKWLKSETVGKPHKQEVEDVFFSIYKGAKKIQAEKLLDSADKNCAPYLKHDTGQAFGVAENCYLCIDSGKPGIENAVKIIEASYHTLS